MGEDAKWVRFLLLLLILCPLFIATIATAWLMVRGVMDAERLVQSINMSMPYTEKLITIAVTWITRYLNTKNNNKSLYILYTLTN